MVGAAPPAQAATIIVTTTDDELNGDGDCAFREAIEAANADAAVDACPAGSGADTITVPAGAYTLAVPGTGENANQTGDLDITSDITIAGAGPGSTVVDGAGLDRVFHVFPSTSQISDLTVTGGGDTASSTVCEGAGILNQGPATLTLTNVTVSGNSGGAGGGINNSGTMIINDSTISGNSAKKRGGGIENASVGTTLTINNSTISGNTGGGFGSFMDPPCVGLSFFGAGGIFNADGGTLALNDSTVSGNTAVQNGGGIYNYAALGTESVTLDRTTVSGNHADNGGGGFTNSANLTLTNSTVSGNSDHSPGGGFWIFGGAVTLNSSTVSDNGSAFGTGGIGATGGTVTMGGTILANSTSGGDCSGSTITSTGYNLIEDTSGCTITGDPTGNITGIDPMLGPLADNGGPTLTHALLVGSPALDAGGSTCPVDDQRGVERPQGAACDDGSFEMPVGVAEVIVDPEASLGPTGRVTVTGGILCGPTGDTFNIYARVDQTSTGAVSKVGLVTGTCSGDPNDAWTVTPRKKPGSPAFVTGAARACVQARTFSGATETDRVTVCNPVTIV